MTEMTSVADDQLDCSCEDCEEKHLHYGHS
jgi:hypothetical protein